MIVLTAVVDQTSYSVVEGIPSVSVCVRLSGGSLARQVVVMVFTEDGTAQGTRELMLLINRKGDHEINKEYNNFMVVYS